ncbi:hypothetical protein [Rubrivivax rivuli]|nr:hypothetical protein [Rubrivivax rivuli]
MASDPRLNAAEWVLFQLELVNLIYHRDELVMPASSIDWPACEQA